MANPDEPIESPNPSAEIPARYLTRCRELREAAQLSQMDLAVKAGLGLSTIIKLDTLTSPEALEAFQLSSVLAVARAFGVSLATLIPSLAESPNASTPDN